MLTTMNTNENTFPNPNASKKRLVNAARWTAAAGAVGTAFTVSMNALAHDALEKSFSRHAQPSRDPLPDEVPTQSISFMSGDETLYGFIYGAGTRGLVVFTHGMNTQHTDYLDAILLLARRGWRVLAYDCTGAGHSDGDSQRGLTQALVDLDAALTFVEQRYDLAELPRVLFGHSQGGFASCAVLALGHKADAVVSVSGFVSAQRGLMGTAELRYGPAAWALYPFLKADVKRTFDAFADVTAVDGLNAQPVPALIIHGENDITIPFRRDSINAQAKRINNPNAAYLVSRTPGRRGHSDILWSTNEDGSKVPNPDIYDTMDAFLAGYGL